MPFAQGVDDLPTGSPPMIGKRLDLDTWLAYVGSYNFGSIPPTSIVLHHTIKPTQETWAGLTTMKAMQRYYRGLGWTAAPHIFVAPDGIWLFTSMYDVGIHANSGNATFKGNRLLGYSIGIEMVGNFDREVPKGPVWELTKGVIGGLMLRRGWKPEDHVIHPHREYNKGKSCPGWAVSMPWVEQEVRSWLNERLWPEQTPVVGPPTIDVHRFVNLLTAYGSPAAGEAAQLYAILVDHGIEPAIALGFFWHESKFGTVGLCKDYNLKNWGNVRTPEKADLGVTINIPGRGNFARYSTWARGVLDWCHRLRGPKYAGSGLHTVETIIPKYAPSTDSNRPEVYIRSVKAYAARAREVTG